MLSLFEREICIIKYLRRDRWIRRLFLCHSTNLRSLTPARYVPRSSQSCYSLPKVVAAVLASCDQPRSLSTICWETPKTIGRVIFLGCAECRRTGDEATVWSYVAFLSQTLQCCWWDAIQMFSCDYDTKQTVVKYVMCLFVAVVSNRPSWNGKTTPHPLWPCSSVLESRRSLRKCFVVGNQQQFMSKALGKQFWKPWEIALPSPPFADTTAFFFFFV